MTDPARGGDVVLRADGIAKRFGDRAVLDGVTLSVCAGDFVSVAGRSGSGKSTLIHILSGLDAPDEGVVTVRRQALSSMPAEDRAEFRLRNIGIVFQHFNLLPDLTVLENVALPLKLAHVPSRERRERAEELLELFGLIDFANRFPDLLSGGELQRVAVARGLAPRPAVVLADEPTANLDDRNAKDVIEALKTAARFDAGVLVASHDSLVVEATPRRLQIADGRLEAQR